MRRAVVLSGGGSKGSYEVGVWKALRKLKIKYDIVTGTSIGALNGALMAQGSYLKARFIWHKLNLEYLFNKQPASEKDLDVLKLFGDNFIKNGGMEISRIEKIIKRAIRPKRFFKSSIDYGLVTYNFTTKKPVSLTKEEIDEDKISDYLMASATCFPAFQMKEIDGEKFIDGGFYDNLPINLALKLGAEELIVVDLRAPGFKRKSKSNCPMIYITPKNNISFFLNFNKKQALENINFGYNDTMKAFDKLDGHLFTFKKKEITHAYYTFKSPLENIFDKRVTAATFLKTVEELGRMFELREDKIYSFKKFKKCLTKAVDEQEALKKEVIKQITSLQVKKMTSSKPIVLYFLATLGKRRKIDVALTTLFAKDYKRAVFLHVMGITYGK